MAKLNRAMPTEPMLVHTYSMPANSRICSGRNRAKPYESSGFLPLKHPRQVNQRGCPSSMNTYAQLAVADQAGTTIGKALRGRDDTTPFVPFPIPQTYGSAIRS